MMRKKLPASRKARIWSFPYRMVQQENNVDPCTTITVMKHWIGPEEAKMATLVSWVS